LVHSPSPGEHRIVAGAAVEADEQEAMTTTTSVFSERLAMLVLLEVPDAQELGHYVFTEFC
jgi:hypothetical protein